MAEWTTPSARATLIISSYIVTRTSSCMIVGNFLGATGPPSGLSRGLLGGVVVLAPSSQTFDEVEVQHVQYGRLDGGILVHRTPQGAVRKLDDASAGSAARAVEG